MKRQVKKNVSILALSAACAFAMVGACSLAVKDAVAETVQPVETVETLSTFTMPTGASVRIETDGNGIRFMIKMDKQEYESLMANTAYSEIDYGVLIAPATYDEKKSLKTAFDNDTTYAWAVKNEQGEWVYDEVVNAGKTRIMNIETNNLTWSDEDNAYVFYASIIDILPENIARDFAAYGYLEYTTAGETPVTDYVWANEEGNVRSMVYVAQAAIAKGDLDKKVVDDLKANYVTPVLVDQSAENYYDFDLSVETEAYEIAIPSVGKVTHILDESAKEVAFTYDGGEIAVAKETVNAFGTGEKTLYVHTNRKVYKLKTTIASLVIDSKDDLDKFPTIAKQNLVDGNAKKFGGYFVMASDVDYENKVWAEWVGYANSNTFCGTFDGRGYAIKNLNITRTDSNYTQTGYAFIGRLGKTGIIKNVAFIEPTVTIATGHNTAVVVGIADSGSTIENVYVELDVDKLLVATNKLTDNNLIFRIFASDAGAGCYGNIVNCFAKVKGDLEETITAKYPTAAGLSNIRLFYAGGHRNNDKDGALQNGYHVLKNCYVYGDCESTKNQGGVAGATKFTVGMATGFDVKIWAVDNDGYPVLIKQANVK